MVNRWVVVLVAASVLVPALANCGGRSSDIDGDGSGGFTPTGGAQPTGGSATTGGASPVGGSVAASGGSAGGSTGATGGSGPTPPPLCRMTVDPGPCRGLVPSYWFDASTGVCMPFNYGGCEGNFNRFDTMEACYAACGGTGDRDDAACTESWDCMPFRLAEPCCSLDVRQFVGITRGRESQFSCNDPMLGCTLCAADCDYVPEDGYIGATCTDRHCIPFDARTLGGASCTLESDCYPRYGVECCATCPSNQYPSKLVALSNELELDPIACGDGLSCSAPDGCNYDAITNAWNGEPNLGRPNQRVRPRCPSIAPN